MTTFIGMRERTSGEIRGRQIASVLRGAKFVDVRDHRSIFATRDETVVFVRQFEPQLAKLLKQNGCIIGFDLLDRPVADYHQRWKQGMRDDLDWRIYANEFIDFFLVNNTATKQRLSFVCSTQSFVVPHHTVNFDRCKRTRKRVSRVGYIGTADQMLLQNEVASFCKSRGVSFDCAHPNTQRECDDMLRNIDVGVIFIDSTEHRDYVLKYKPNTKLNNFQSYGIPTIACSYESFIEFGGIPGESWIRADDKEEFMSQLERLVIDSSFYSTIAEQSFLTGDNFHIDAIAQKYYAQLPGVCR